MATKTGTEHAAHDLEAGDEHEQLQIGADVIVHGEAQGADKASILPEARPPWIFDDKPNAERNTASDKGNDKVK